MAKNRLKTTIFLVFLVHPCTMVETVKSSTEILILDQKKIHIRPSKITILCSIVEDLTIFGPMKNNETKRKNNRESL